MSLESYLVLAPLLTATALSAASAPPLIAFTDLPYSWFDRLPFLPLPYTGDTPSSLNATWVFGVSCCDYSKGRNPNPFFTSANIKRANTHYAPFLTPQLECTGCRNEPIAAENISNCIGEWGYEFHHFSVTNPAFSSSPCVNITMASLQERWNVVPHDREEAYAFMNRYYDCRKQAARAKVVIQ